MALKIWLDGKVVPENEARISPSNRGLLFGDGLYETLLCKGSIPAFADAHAQRLAHGCASLGMHCDWTGQTIRERAATLARANNVGEGLSRLRITITRDDNADFYGIGDSAWSMATMRSVDANALNVKRHNGIQAVTAPERRAPDAGVHNVKTISMAPIVWNRRAILADGAEDAIVLNTRGEVCEALTNNVFAVVGGHLVTPPLDSPCLPGVMRGLVLEWAKELGIPTEVRPLLIGELATASEIFLTSSIIRIVPVVTYDRQPVGSGKSGHATRTLQEAALRAETAEFAELT